MADNFEQVSSMELVQEIHQLLMDREDALIYFFKSYFLLSQGGYLPSHLLLSPT